MIIPRISAPPSAPRAMPSPATWPRLVALHLGPGVALLLFHLITAPLLHRTGLPRVWGLLIGTLVVLAPLELALVLGSADRRGLRPWWRALGLQRVTGRDLGPLLLAGALSALAPGVVLGLEPIVRRTVFNWLPDWLGAGVGELSTSSPPIVALTVVLWLVSVVVVGPIVEEIYFRGWLLPRVPGRAVPAAAVNAALFGAYHLWQPYALLTVIAFALPAAVLVRCRPNPTLSVAVHCGVNALTFAALLAGVVRR